MLKHVKNEPADWAALRASLVALIEEIKKQPSDLKRAQEKAQSIIRRYKDGDKTEDAGLEKEPPSGK